MSINFALMLMIKPLLLSLIILMLSACLLMGESAAKVNGKVSDEKGRAYSNCSIDLLIITAKNRQRLNYRKRQIRFNEKHFEQVFIIKPDDQTYSVEITCLDSSELYQSSALVLKDSLDKPVNLGHIILKRMPE